MADEAVLRIVLKDDSSGVIPSPTLQPSKRQQAGQTTSAQVPFTSGYVPPAAQFPYAQIPFTSGYIPPTAQPFTTANAEKILGQYRRIKEDLSATNTLLSNTVDIITRLRGTIGGLAGTLTGSILDVLTAYKKATVDAAESSKFANSLVEASKNAYTFTYTKSATAARVGTLRAAKASVATSAMAAKTNIAVAAVIALTTAVIAATKAMVNFADKAEQQYAGYSPQIASAQAYAEIRQVMGDFRRAQIIATDMARYVKAKADLQQRYEDIKLAILQKILPTLTGIMKVLEKIAPIAEFSIKSILTPFGMIRTIVEEIRDILKDPKPFEGPTDAIFLPQEKGGVQIPLF